MNARFPVLTFIAMLFRIIGVLLFAIGLFAAVYYGFIADHSPPIFSSLSEPAVSSQGSIGTNGGVNNVFSSPSEPAEFSRAVVILSGICQIITGMIIFAFGEIIGVLFAIEKNTRSFASNPLQTTNDSTTHA